MTRHQDQYSFSRGRLVRCMALSLALQMHISNCAGFSSPSFVTATKSVLSIEAQPSSTTLHMSGGGFGGGAERDLLQQSKAAFSAKGDFAYQEMRAQLDAMKRQGLASGQLPMDKRIELEGYVRSVVSHYFSGLRLNAKDIGKALVPQSKWRLAFSTQSTALTDLPVDATVYLHILDEENLDYTLKFSQKTMGLNSLTAKSKYSFDSGPVQPGLLTYVYDKITTDLFGFKGLGVGAFGMLKGRANFVQSAYFDGFFWIEEGRSADGQETYYNVYMRETDDEE